MKKQITTLLFVFISSLSFSQDTSADSSTSTNAQSHYIGFNVGAASGLGFSYKFIKNRFGIQVTGIPVFNDGDIWTSAGLAITWRKKKKKLDDPFTFLFYGGTHYIYDRSNNGYYYRNIMGDVVYSDSNEQQLNSALGFGFEYQMSKNFLFNLMAGYGVIVDYRAKSFISGEIGIHYKL